MSIRCFHYIIKGHVQGVFFRANTNVKANELGLTGWVRNLSTGDVEVWAQGEEQILEGFYQWLLKAPFGGRVDEIIQEENLCILLFTTGKILLADAALIFPMDR